MIKKIILGTANFGSDYGIVNKSYIKPVVAEKILSIAFKNGISNLDTAPDYKNSEIILGKIGVSKFNISTKILIPEKSSYNYKKFFHDNINASFDRLNIRKLSILYFRKPISLLSGENNKLWNYAKTFKKEGLIDKIGITIYDPQELDLVFDDLKPDVVQAPYNLFDQRLEKSGWLDRLYANKVIIQPRSIFLQGLLLCSLNKIPKRFYKFKLLWKKYSRLVKRYNLTILEANINFINQNKKISNFLIGIENVKQLTEIINVKKRNIKYAKQLSTLNRDIIDPRLWNKS